MPEFEINTFKIVHRLYMIECETEEEARLIALDGEVDPVEEVAFDMIDETGTKLEAALNALDEGS